MIISVKGKNLRSFDDEKKERISSQNKLRL